MKVSAISVSFGTGHLLPALIEQLRAEPVVDDIILIHNASGSQSGAVPETFRGTRQIHNAENLGFARAVNQGVDAARQRWVLIVNPDVRLGPRCVEQLCAAAEEHGAPMVGPRFYWDDERTFRLPPATGSTAWFESALRLSRAHRLDAQALDLYWTRRHDWFWLAEQPFVEPFLSGACFLADRQRLASQGATLLDERYFLYYEDTDACARMLSEGDYPLCTPHAWAVHWWNQSPDPSRPKSELMGESKDLYLQSRYGRIDWPAVETSEPPHPVTDLGSSERCPACPHSMGEAIWFEMGASALLIPFTQAQWTAVDGRLPDELWSRLGPGAYFFRARDRAGRTLGRWRVTKPPG